jgi:hypothetical protein
MHEDSPVAEINKQKFPPAEYRMDINVSTNNEYIFLVQVFESTKWLKNCFAEVDFT